MSYKLPHEIRSKDGTSIYRCRSCGTDENLRWFGGTSCPVCTKIECINEIRREFNEAYFSDDENNS